MARRLELQERLTEMLGSDNVYFQPPPSLDLKYPCIIYKRDYRQNIFADNIPYNNRKRYEIMVIDLDPDGIISDKIATLPLCTFVRFFTADNLNHDIFNLFF